MTEQQSELTQIWEQAVDEYLNKSKRGSVAQRWKVPITTQDDLNKLIEQHESDFLRFRKSRKRFWDGLMATMGQLQNLGNVAQAALQLSPFAPAAVVLEAGLFLVSSGAAVADTYDSLETLFRRVRDITDRLGEYLKVSLDHKLQQVVIKLLSSLLDVFGEAEAAIRRGRGKEMMRRVTGKENTIQVALDRLDEWVQTEIALITAKTFATTQRIDEKVDNERDRLLLRRSLCAEVASDNEAFGKNIEASRISRSGDWILKERLFDKWFQREFPVLWVLGKPGTGKTYLASRIVSHIRQNSGLASFFYIREGMNTQHDPESILKAIAYQVTGLYGAYREQAVAVCNDGDSLLLPKSLWESLFVKPFNTGAAKPLFVVIDGLDEATTKNQELIVKLAKNLSDMRSKTRKNPVIQLLLLGRPDLDYNVSNVWRGEKRRPKILHIEPSMSRSDVERFIKKGVTEGIPLLQKMRPGPSKRLRREIVKTLSDSSDGMFMLAKLMLAEVKDMNKPELVREALSKPPQGLDEMFRRVVARLDVTGGFDKQDLNELIMWVACAKRDLRLGELDLVLKLRDLRQNGIVGLEDELRTRFGSFFSIVLRDTEVESEDEGEGEEETVSVAGSDTTLADSVSKDSDPGDESDAEWEDERQSDNNLSDNDLDDYESDDDTPPQFFTATVKFGHASVGQHFRTASIHRGIGMDLHFAQAHIALTCVGFLTDNIPKRKQKPWREPDLFRYSSDYFLDHFVEVDLDELEITQPDLFESLSKEVSYLFNDHDSLGRWFHNVPDEQRFMCQLFSENVCSKLRQCSMKTNTHNKDTTESLKKESSTSDSVLLEPFAHCIAKAWLSDESCDSMVAVLFLQGYLFLRDRKTFGQWTLPPNRPFEHIAEGISPEQIRKMSALCGLERNMHFYLALGSTFAKIRTSQHLLAAVDEFEHAIQLTEYPEWIWLAYKKKAKVLSRLGESRDAIVAASKALDLLPEDRFYKKKKLLRLIQDAYLHLGNRDAALAAAASAWECAPSDPTAAFRLIYTAHKTGSYTETVKIMRSALESSNGAKFLGRIIDQMVPQRYTTEYMSIACAKIGDLDLAKDAFTAVKSEARDSGAEEIMAAADEALAQLYFGFYHDEEKAIDLWEDIIRNYPSTRPAFEASYALMPWYFTKGKEADPTEAHTWLSKMEHLVAAIEAMTPSPSMSLAQYEVAALLGRWFAEQGETELARAKIHPYVKASICNLTDRDDSNDYDAYHSLARALLCFGHREHAAIAWAFTKPIQSAEQLLGEAGQHVPNANITTVPAVDTEVATPFSWLGRCDGACDRPEVVVKSFSMCEICVDVAFCDECEQKLRDGMGTFTICNPAHPFMEIYPPRGLVTKDAEGYKVHLEEEKVVSASEWLAMVSREWIGE